MFSETESFMKGIPMKISFSKILRVLATNKTHKTHMFILVVFTLAILAGCSTNEPSPNQIHYYNPVWTPDGKAAVFGLYRGIPSGDNLSSSLLYMVDTIGRQIEFSVPPMNTLNRRFWVDSISHSLAFTQNGISFFSLPVYPSPTSNLLGSYMPSLSGRQPTVMSFSPLGHAFLWAGNTNGMLTVGYVSYADKPWLPIKETVLLDSSTSTQPQDIIFITSTTYAIRLSDGRIRHCDVGKSLIHEYIVTPFVAANLWQYHLTYYNVPGSPQRIYAAQQNGFVQCLPDSLSVQLLVDGGLVNYDVSQATRFMIYETNSFDTWLATDEGIPLARLLPHNGMSRFSPDGMFIAAVGAVTPLKDTVTVKRLP